MKKFFALCLAGVLLCLTACSAEKETKNTKIDTAMGTVVSMTVYSEDAETVQDEMLAEIRYLEENILSKKIASSEIGRVNAEAGSEDGTPVSDFCGDLLLECLALTLSSENAFDPTIGPLIQLWNIDEQAVTESAAVPSKEEIDKALAACGLDKINLIKNADGYRVFLKEGASIDLGAVGKGMALEILRNMLKEKQEVKGAVVTIGGSVLAYGEKPDGSDWKVGIVDPFTAGESLGVLTVPAGYCVSTSGDYERYIEVDGKKYHHILDEKTGYPAESGVRSVTILCESGWQSDAFSTACFVLGEKEGKKLAESFGIEALFVLEDGTVSMTAGMEGYFTRNK